MTTRINGLTGVDLIKDGTVTPQDLATFAGLGNYADDTAAAAGGVPIGGLYRTGSTLKVRVS